MVPSSGSTIQVRPDASALAASVAAAALAAWCAPDSSARIPSPGNASRMAPRIIASDRWSTSVTTSLGDLWSMTPTCSYRSNSRRPARSAIARAKAASAAKREGATGPGTATPVNGRSPR